MPAPRLQLWLVSFIQDGEEFSEFASMNEPNAQVVAQYLKDRLDEGKIDGWEVTFLDDDTGMPVQFFSREFNERFGAELDYWTGGNLTHRNVTGPAKWEGPRPR